MISIHTRTAPCGRRWRLRLPWGALALCLAGCHHDASAPYGTWVDPSPAPTDNGAYATYRRIGVEAEAAARGIQPRAAPTSAQVKDLDARLEPFLSRITAADRLRLTDEYVPTVSLTPDLARIGWSFLGHYYERRLRAAIAGQDYDSAVSLTVSGTRFGLAIACGDASDALVGLPLADDIRRVLAPVLRDLSAAQLQKLANGLTEALYDRLPVATVIGHERLAMLASVQAVQEAYKNNELAQLQVQLGPTVRDATETLDGYRGRAESKRVEFFNAMAVDAETEAAWLAKSAATTASQRTPEPSPKPSSRAPWHALARQFILAGGPMLATTDLTIARTRLFAITAGLYAIAKTSGAAPRSLSAFPRALNIDPYTGRGFYYVPEGLDFRLYSAGVDGVDNEGETDESGVTPDVILEGSG